MPFKLKEPSKEAHFAAEDAHRQNILFRTTVHLIISNDHYAKRKGQKLTSLKRLKEKNDFKVKEVLGFESKKSEVVFGLESSKDEVLLMYASYSELISKVPPSKPELLFDESLLNDKIAVGIVKISTSGHLIFCNDGDLVFAETGSKKKSKIDESLPTSIPSLFFFPSFKEVMDEKLIYLKSVAKDLSTFDLRLLELEQFDPDRAVLKTLERNVEGFCISFALRRIVTFKKEDHAHSVSKFSSKGTLLAKVQVPQHCIHEKQAIKQVAAVGKWLLFACRLAADSVKYDLPTRHMTYVLFDLKLMRWANSLHIEETSNTRSWLHGISTKHADYFITLFAFSMITLLAVRSQQVHLLCHISLFKANPLFGDGSSLTFTRSVRRARKDDELFLVGVNRIRDAHVHIMPFVYLLDLY